jgi:hypothetical protein
MVTVSGSRSSRRPCCTACSSKTGCDRCARNACSSSSDIATSPSHDRIHARPALRTRHGLAEPAVAATLAMMIGSPASSASMNSSCTGGTHARALPAKPCLSTATADRVTGTKPALSSRPRTTHPPPGRLATPRRRSCKVSTIWEPAWDDYVWLVCCECPPHQIDVGAVVEPHNVDDGSVCRTERLQHISHRGQDLRRPRDRA